MTMLWPTPTQLGPDTVHSTRQVLIPEHYPVAYFYAAIWETSKQAQADLRNWTAAHGTELVKGTRRLYVSKARNWPEWIVHAHQQTVPRV